MSFFGDAWDMITGKNKFQPDTSKIANPATAEQANQALATSQDAIKQQQAFVQALQGQNGIQNQSNVYNQLQGVANGTGPNPALAQLQNATGANVANQAALMAGQRGGNANAGLIARQAGQQGAQIQQNAAGQAAALQAQQSLNAIGQSGQIAGQQVANQAQGVGALNSFAQNEQNSLYNQINNQNQIQMGLNQLNSGIAAGNAAGQARVLGGLANAGGAALGIPGLGGAAGGGGGTVQAQPMQSAPISGPSLGVDYQNSFNAGPNPFAPKPYAQGGEVKGGPSSKVAQIFINGAPAMAAGGPVQGEMLAAKGKMVPGKAKVKGDSLKNDNVKALLSPGEIVIPRSIAQGKDAPKKAADFVAAILMKSKRK